MDPNTPQAPYTGQPVAPSAGQAPVGPQPSMPPMPQPYPPIQQPQQAPQAFAPQPQPQPQMPPMPQQFAPQPVAPPMPQQSTQPQMPPTFAPMPGPAPQNPMYAMPTPAAQGPQAAPGTAPAAPVIKANPNSTQNTLQIAEIRDGVVIMNDGSFRSVVMVKSINFDLMSAQEREAVEYSFQGFLNALYFPVQIFVRSQRVELRPYLERLDKIRKEHDNMLLALLMEDYLAFMESLALQTNIMDKKFYVVVPFFPVNNIQKIAEQSKSFFSGLAGLFNTKEQHVVVNEADLANAKDELRNRVQAVLGSLQQCGVQGLPLDTQELIELYYDTYNPDTATRQQLKNFDDLTAPVVTKGEGLAPQPHLDRELR